MRPIDASAETEPLVNAVKMFEDGVGIIFFLMPPNSLFKQPLPRRLFGID